MKTDINHHEEKKIDTKGIKFYNKYGILLGSFLGGPLATVYLIYKNYINLKNPDYAKKTVIIGTILSILLFLIMDFLPDDFSKSCYLIPLFVSYFSFYKLQGSTIENVIKKGGKLYSFRNVFGIGLLFSVISIVIIIGIATISGQY